MVIKNKISDPLFDIDSYINRLERTIEFQQYTINSLKTEIRTQRKEIGALREERKRFLQDDNPPNFDYDLK
jgi:uncharacterized coiled-coil protein SlyX